MADQLENSSYISYNFNKGQEKSLFKKIMSKQNVRTMKFQESEKVSYTCRDYRGIFFNNKNPSGDSVSRLKNSNGLIFKNQSMPSNFSI